MSVYVGALFPCQSNPRWRWNEAAHLFGDTAEELHRFARRLGLRRSWCQREGNGLPFLHYDLTRNMRQKAVLLGATEASLALEVEYFRRMRKTHGKEA